MNRLCTLTTIFNSLVCNLFSFFGIYAAASANKFNLPMSW